MPQCTFQGQSPCRLSYDNNYSEFTTINIIILTEFLQLCCRFHFSLQGYFEVNVLQIKQKV